jgi:multiple sugar transport system substrate-binding protein
MSYSWDDAFVQAQQADSRSQQAAAPLPGAREVWNRKTKQWDKFEEPNRAPYITWGWTSAVSAKSKNQDMAFDYLCFFSNEANTLSDLQVGRFGVNPYRTSHFDPALWTDKLAGMPILPRATSKRCRARTPAEPCLRPSRSGVSQFATSARSRLGDRRSGDTAGSADQWPRSGRTSSTGSASTGAGLWPRRRSGRQPVTPGPSKGGASQAVRPLPWRRLLSRVLRPGRMWP